MRGLYLWYLKTHSENNMLGQGVMLNFLCFFVMFIAVKTLQIDIIPYGENFYDLTYWDKI